ncbi:MAG: hypothetical protein H0V27_08710 [Pyrinomonadaceae bacterium]|nr:hypothetical protein [Pyrinomonadaceae bacterium]
MALRRGRPTATKVKQQERPTHDNQPTVDEQLTRLEEDIRRLKVEFDIYFNGGSKRPPYDTKSRVESTTKRLADERNLSFAQRYRYNSLVARYTSFRELWRRTIQSREEGRDQASVARSIGNKEEADGRNQKLPRETFVCADAHRDVETVKSLYDALVEAKRQCGEPTDDFSFPRFHRLVAQKTDALKQSLNCDRILFSISVEGGHVQFKAKGEE